MLTWPPPNIRIMVLFVTNVGKINGKNKFWNDIIGDQGNAPEYYTIIILGKIIIIYVF